MQPKNNQVSTEEALSELLRERQVRERCYDRWVERGQLTMVDARDRMERLCHAITILERLQGIEESATVTRTGDSTPANAPE